MSHPCESAGSGPVNPCSRLSYKYQRMRERIRAAITSGELVGKLPGERELARRFGANAKTIGKAMTDLAAEGLLLRYVGRGTFVAPAGDAAEPAAVVQRIGWISATDPADENEERLFAQASALATPRGWELVRRDVPVDDDGVVRAGVIRARGLRRFDGLLLHAVRPSPEVLADWIRRRVRFVLAGTADETVRTGCVLPDLSRGAFELTEHLIALGHREIWLAADHAADGGGHAAQGYTASLRRHGLAPRQVLCADAEEAARAVVAGDEPCGAVVCMGGTLARAVCAEATRAGLRIPSDLSVGLVAMPADETGEALTLTSYDVDPVHVLRWALELLHAQAAGQAPGVVIVPGRLTDRGSCRPPRTWPGRTAPRDTII